MIFRNAWITCQWTTPEHKSQNFEPRWIRSRRSIAFDSKSSRCPVLSSNTAWRSFGSLHNSNTRLPLLISNTETYRQIKLEKINFTQIDFLQQSWKTWFYAIVIWVSLGGWRAAVGVLFSQFSLQLSILYNLDVIIWILFISFIVTFHPEMNVSVGNTNIAHTAGNLFRRPVENVQLIFSHDARTASIELDGS